MVKLVTVRAKPREYKAFYFDSSVQHKHDLPPDFMGRVFTLTNGERRIVLVAFGREITYKEGTWFIQKQTGFWEAKKTKASFEVNYEIMEDNNVAHQAV